MYMNLDREQSIAVVRYQFDYAGLAAAGMTAELV
jgi:hypothetical protein